MTATVTSSDTRNDRRQIAATDRQIDQLVYELYELSPDELDIIEESSS